MLELGPDSQAEHQAILRYAARCKPDLLVLVGEEFGHTTYGRYGALHFPDADAARAWYQKQQFENTAQLLKGSRGIRLETLLDPIP